VIGRKDSFEPIMLMPIDHSCNAIESVQPYASSVLTITIIIIIIFAHHTSATAAH